MNSFCLLAVSLAPLLGGTQTFSQAVVTGLAMITLIALHQTFLGLLRNRLEGSLCTLANLLLVAGLTSCLQMALSAWALPLAISLSFFPTLVALQCLATDALLPRENRYRQLLKYLCALLATTLLLGAMRQGLAEGLGVHLASLPAGGLLLLAVLLALYNWLHPGALPSCRQGKR
ncbi:Rnf-Nqr domain containing protein [Pseudomonas sp. PSKL.D1]|uniref:Rnf-Nqr domain containing protein n=1 Tax=Pseudomonas sp. PSKL.D1 TaxID=3029060 RepID=UPI002380F683|nr:Rnf-Nqr domain containing protein [Pseudomonas sp. PSKL.D1]WDY59120.1 Rnf-Nqr domain containing protein [Pseudomonas sp. PSKL.D1]